MASRATALIMRPTALSVRPTSLLVRGLQLRAVVQPMRKLAMPHHRTIISAIREQLKPTRSLWHVIFWRGIRVARIGFLAGMIYQCGKASGHIEVLEDPDGMAKAIVKEVVESAHADESNSGKEPGWHKRGSPLHDRVASVGENVLRSARDAVSSKLRALPASRDDEDATITQQREELESAAKRLRGTWHWVVTNSDAVNAFVAPNCPRRVFVCEGLLNKLKLTDDVRT